jgi:hypothetical protein
MGTKAGEWQCKYNFLTFRTMNILMLAAQKEDDSLRPL